MWFMKYKAISFFQPFFFKSYDIYLQIDIVLSNNQSLILR